MKKLHQVYYFILATIFVAVMAGCASSKKVTQSTTKIDPTQLLNTAVEYSAQQSQIAHGIQSKANLTFTLGSQEVSVGGQIKMVRDEIIQLSLTMMGIMEIARIELTPAYVMIQDRYHKLYVQAGWNEICLDSLGVSFETFQALFWEELFIPGNKQHPSINDFIVSSESNNVILPVKSQVSGTNVSFVLDETNGKIKETLIALSEIHTLDLVWDYLSWENLGSVQFPNCMQLQVGKGQQELTVRLDLSKIEVNNNLANIATDVNKEKYQAITMDDILKQYLNVNPNNY